MTDRIYFWVNWRFNSTQSYINKSNNLIIADAHFAKSMLKHTPTYIYIWCSPNMKSKLRQ